MADKTKHTWLDTFTMAVSALVLIAFTALSCYLNMVYAVAHHEDVRYHVALPVLALLAGIFAEVIFMSNVNSPTRWLTGLLVAIGFAAVMLASYMAVLGVAVAQYPSFPAALVYVLAAFPDGFMVIGATVMLALRVRRTKLRGVGAKVSAPSRWRRLADAAAARAERALTEPARTERAPEPAERAPAPAPPPTTSARTTARTTAARTEPTARTPERASVSAEHRARARALIDSRATRASEHDVACALALIDAGSGTAEIERETGIKRDALRRLRRADAELVAAETDADLALVG